MHSPVIKPSELNAPARRTRGKSSLESCPLPFCNSSLMDITHWVMGTHPFQCSAPSDASSSMNSKLPSAEICSCEDSTAHLSFPKSHPWWWTSVSSSDLYDKCHLPQTNKNKNCTTEHVRNLRRFFFAFGECIGRFGDVNGWLFNDTYGELLFRKILCARLCIISLSPFLGFTKSTAITLGFWTLESFMTANEAMWNENENEIQDEKIWLSRIAFYWNISGTIVVTTFPSSDYCN